MMAMATRKTAAPACPAERFQLMVSGKYKLRILWGLREGAKRYGEIRKGLLSGGEGSKEIAARVLSRELKQLAETHMIARKDFRLVPPKVEYSLTATGESFLPVIAEIRQWGERHLASAPQRFKRHKEAA
jgi:DNA-binding HxlR family transcriptional regulator